MASFQSGPSVWYGPEISKKPEQWLYHLSPEQLEELYSATELILSSSTSGGSPQQIPLSLLSTLEPFSLPLLTPTIAALLKQLQDGLGFFVWRGIPVESWSHARSCAAFLLIGRCMGKLLQQNAKGHLLGHVKDLGLASNDPNVRVYQTSERQTFHTDSADVVGLLCLQTAKSGGLSSLVSASTVYNEILGTRPDLAAELLNPFPTDKRGEVVPGTKPYFLLPVYSPYEGYLSVKYQRQYINSSQRFPEAPRLTVKQVEALDLFDKTNDDPRLNFTMQLERGDMQFVNNFALLHDRTAFVDWEEEGRRRHLLRVWIAPALSRPLPPAFAEKFGSVKIGDRGGNHLPGVEPIAPLHP